MSHLYGCRTGNLSAAQWPSFIDAMVECRLIDRNTEFTATETEATLSGEIQQGEAFCISITLDADGIAAVRKLAVAMSYNRPMRGMSLSDRLNLNAGKSQEVPF